MDFRVSGGGTKFKDSQKVQVGRSGAWRTDDPDWDLGGWEGRFHLVVDVWRKGDFVGSGDDQCEP